MGLNRKILILHQLVMRLLGQYAFGSRNQFEQGPPARIESKGKARAQDPIVWWAILSTTIRG